MTTIRQFIQELEKLGNEFGDDTEVQISGCYGATTQDFDFENAKIDADFKAWKVVNIPSDFCSG